MADRRTRSTRPPAAGKIARMNAGHANAMLLCRKAFSKAIDITSASLTSIDRYGFEIPAQTQEGPRPVRLAFAKPVSTPEGAHATVISMLRDARSKLS